MNEMTALANIEYRIQYHMQGAYANLLEVGRALTEAKESGLVPHGEWEDWVRRTCDMSERSAQRLMQAAREVGPESAMAKLPISKIQTILALPEPEREAVAVKAVEENTSLRELQDEVKALKQKLEESEVSETWANKKMEAARKSAEDARRNLDIALTERSRMQTERDAAAAALKEALEKPAEGISPEAQEKINALQAQLSDMEQMAQYQARERQAAQKELTELKSRQARGDARPREDLTAESVGVAVRTFMGTMGFLPHSGRLLGMNEGDREEVRALARMIGAWAQDVEDVLGSAVDAIELVEG